METQELIHRIALLKPGSLGDTGTVSIQTLRAISKHCIGVMDHTLETGCGRTTLLFSNISRNHDVFALDSEGMQRIRVHELVGSAAIRFIEGPTQKTMPTHVFDCMYDAILLDGPHGYPFPEIEYFFCYPNLKNGGLLILDDIDIPTIDHMYRVLRQDDMFEPIGVFGGTGFLKRTFAPLFYPYGDGWGLQNYNTRHYPTRLQTRMALLLARVIPKRIKTYLRRWIIR